MRHFYLYAKNHYEITNLIEDMKVLMGKRCLISPEQVDIWAIRDQLVREVFQYIKGKRELVEFVRRIDAHVSEQGYEYNESVIRACLGILSFQKIVDIPIELGKADPNVLPLRSKKSVP